MNMSKMENDSAEEYEKKEKERMRQTGDRREQRKKGGIEQRKSPGRDEENWDEPHVYPTKVTMPVEKTQYTV